MILQEEIARLSIAERIDLIDYIWETIPAKSNKAAVSVQTEDAGVAHSEMIEGYKAMAADEKYEAEAQEWIESMLGDAAVAGR